MDPESVDVALQILVVVICAGHVVFSRQAELELERNSLEWVGGPIHGRPVAHNADSAERARPAWRHGEMHRDRTGARTTCRPQGSLRQQGPIRNILLVTCPSGAEGGDTGGRGCSDAPVLPRRKDCPLARSRADLWRRHVAVDLLNAGSARSVSSSVSLEAAAGDCAYRLRGLIVYLALECLLRARAFLQSSMRSSSTR